jgi:hypothetical protein
MALRPLDVLFILGSRAEGEAAAASRAAATMPPRSMPTRSETRLPGRRLAVQALHVTPEGGLWGWHFGQSMNRSSWVGEGGGGAGGATSCRGRSCDADGVWPDIDSSIRDAINAPASA